LKDISDNNDKPVRKTTGFFVNNGEAILFLPLKKSTTAFVILSIYSIAFEHL